MKNICDYRELTRIIIEVKGRIQDIYSHRVQYHQETLVMLSDAEYLSEQLGLDELTSVLHDLALSISYEIGCVTAYEEVDAYEFMRYYYSDESVYNDFDFCKPSDYLS